jgi:hypothetical protein
VSIAETEEESNLRRSSRTALGNCFQSAPLRDSLHPFAMLADQILQSLHCFHFGYVEFHRCFADVEIPLAWRGMLCARAAQALVAARSPLSLNYLLLTAGQLELAYSSLPTGRAGILASQCVVLIDVPERAIVRGIDSHVRVIAPARVGGSLYP